jgi:hypothetical protein
MKNTKEALLEIGWSEQLIDALLSPQQGQALPSSMDGILDSTIVSSTDIATEAIELTLSAGEGVVYKV